MNEMCKKLLTQWLPCKAWPELALVLAQGFKWLFVLGKNSTIDSFQCAEIKLNLV